jgi:vanillate O-demethylase monooxygenase subunit
MMIGNVNMLPGIATYPRNQWYVIAFSKEVGRQPFRRECLGDPVMMYRTESGDPVALFDRCPHRGMPLSQGKLIGDIVQCGYHGFEFDRSGKGVGVPSGGAVPHKLCVKSYPLVEKSGWLWIWMGDPALADPAHLPDHRELGLEGEGWYPDPGIHLAVKANYLLPYENLADATHITYLHHGLIDTGNVAAMPYRLERQGNVIKVYRDFVNEPMPDMLRKAFQLRGERINRTLELSSYVPNVVVIRNSFIEVDAADPTSRINTLVVAVTPGNLTSTHQFASFGNNYPQQHPNRYDDLRNLLMEDVVVIEEIQQLFDRLGPAQCPEISVKADEPGIRVRRILADMIQRETSNAAVA